MMTDAEREAENRLKEFARMAAEDPKVDKAALAMAALNEAQVADRVAPKKRRTAYFTSFAIPPFGLLFAIYYYFSPKTDGKRVALFCVILTAVSGLLVWGSLKSMQTMLPQVILGQTSGTPGLEQQIELNGQEIEFNGQKIRLPSQQEIDELKDLLQ